MKRLLLLGALAAAVLVPAAAASPAATHTIRGTVIAKDRAHHGLVVALPGGAVKTVVAPKAFGRTPVGRTVVIRYTGLAGRLPVALGVSLKGHTDHAVVHGTIVRLVRQNAVINAGGNALRVHLTAKAKRVLASVKADPKVGDTVEVEVEIDDNGSLGGSAVVVGAPTGAQAGSEGSLEVRGKVKGPLAPTAITVVTGTGVEVTCVIPDGVTLNVQVDDLIELKCDLIGGKWTVRRAHGEDDHSGHGHDGSAEVKVRGTISAPISTTVTVTPAQGDAVTCTIPTGISLAQFAVDDIVKMECVKVGDTLTLKEIEKKGDHSGEQVGGDDDDDNDDGNGSSGGSDDESGSGGSDD